MISGGLEEQCQGRLCKRNDSQELAVLTFNCVKNNSIGTGGQSKEMEMVNSILTQENCVYFGIELDISLLYTLS